MKVAYRKIIEWVRGTQAVMLFSLLASVANAHTDSLSKVSNAFLSEKYIGYTISFETQAYQINSTIYQLNKRQVNCEGASVGFLYGSHKGMLRTTIGLYYSSSSLSYSVDVLEAGVSKSFYLLHFRSDRPHLIEPYGVISSKVMRSSFYGNVQQGERMSLGEEKLAGRVFSYQSSVGIGAEYQLANEKLNFIHFFTELRVGATLYNSSRYEAFESTRTSKPVLFSLGINFGNIR